MEKKVKWRYYLPNGATFDNMKDAKIYMGISRTRFVGKLKSGEIKREKIYEPQKSQDYASKRAIKEDRCQQSTN